MKTGTKKYQVESKIQSLEVGQSFNKKEFTFFIDCKVKVSR